MTTPREASSLARSRGACGNVSSDNEWVCLLEPGHAPVGEAIDDPMRGWCCDGVPQVEFEEDSSRDLQKLRALLSSSSLGEIDAILAGGRCECGHLGVVHSYDGCYERCDVDGCRCQT